MVNIIDCLRNVVTDKYAMVKIFILSIPVVMVCYATLGGQEMVADIINLVFSVIFAAIFFETIRRSCNAEPMLLPSFLLPVRMFLTLVLTILSAIPVTIICGGIIFGFVTWLKEHPEVAENQVVFYIITSILSLFLISLFFASITQYLDTGKVFDAYNPIKVLKSLKTFIVNFLFYVIQDFLLVSIVIILPAVIIFMIGGKDVNNFFMILYLSMGCVLNYLVFADYIGQTKKDSESPYERLF